MITDTLKPNTGFLLLEDGSVFYGLAAGAPAQKPVKYASILPWQATKKPFLTLPTVGKFW